MIIQHTEAIEAVNNGTDTPDAIFKGSTLIATIEWRKTDEWRGYSEILPASGFKKLDDDWMTGDWSDAPTGHSESEVEVKLKNLEREHGTVHVVFAPTSNVFSTMYAVIVQDGTKTDNGKPHGHKTRLFETEDGYKVRYHATYIFEHNKRKNVYILNSGGWKTRTTKDRINKELPNNMYISQKNFEWFVHTPNETLNFEDGMEVPCLD